MLQSIREFTQGWIAGAIISIIILTFALWGIHSYFIGGSVNPNVAEVNGVGITRSQLSQSYERLKRQIQAQFGATAPAIKDTLIRKQALQILIDNEALKQASLSEGYFVADKQINSFIQTMPEFQVDGQFSVERFQQLMANSMMSVGDFFNVLQANLLVAQPRIGIFASSFALPNEVNYTISLINQQRDFDYLVISKQNFIAKPINITPQQIQAYYDEHKKDFMTPEQVTVEYVQLTRKEVVAKINPTEAALHSFYNDNPNAYMTPMQWKLMDIVIPVAQNATDEENKKAEQEAANDYQSLMSGKDFVMVANGKRGTLSGNTWLTLNRVPSEYQKSVTTLTESEQVTAPFRTSKGLVIIKAVAVQQPVSQSFDQVKDRVKENYLQQQAESKMAEARDQLADITYEHPDSLQSAATTLELPIKVSAPFSKDTGVANDISDNKKVRDVAFSQDVLKNENNSDVIPLNSESLVVIRVKNHEAAKVLSLKEVQSKIEEILKAQIVNDQAQKLAQEILQKLKNGNSPDQVATEYQSKWVKAGMSGQFSKQVDAAISELVFKLPHPEKNKAVYGQTKTADGFAIVKLNAVQAGKLNDDKQFSIFEERTQNTYGELEYELYKKSVLEDAKITTNGV